MLGLSTSFYPQPLIYKKPDEIGSEVPAIWFAFDELTGDNDSAVEEATNKGGAGGDYNVNSVAGEPTVDTTTMSRKSVHFDGTDDILNMAADYETSGKAFTMFWAFQRADTSNEFLFASQAANSSVPDDFVRQASATQFNFDLNNEGAVAVNTNNVDFTGDGSNDTYSLVAGTPTVYVIRRATAGNIVIFADNGIKIATKGNAAIKAGDDLKIGRIGGTTEGSLIELNGNIGEFGIYNIDIGNDDCVELSKALSRKWGVSRHALS